MPAKILGVFLILLALSVQNRDVRAQQPKHRPIPTDVLCNGDDGLTARLCDAVKEALRRSPDFTQDILEKPYILKVTIPTNVNWKTVDGKTKVLYSVEFSLTAEHDLGVAEGSCWDGKLRDCANQILADTRKAAAKIPENGTH
jgi:hypothetical protein